MHSRYSNDSLIRIEDLLSACQTKGIDRIAITDHNQIEGALEAKSLEPEQVIVGEEIQTTDGEILGYFMSDLVPGGLTPMQTVEALKNQGAFISVAHPFDTQRGSRWRPGMLEEILPHIDALEVFNARCRSPKFNDLAFACAQEYGLLQMVGSDAHSIIELGQANLILPEFNDSDSFRVALKSSEFVGRLSGSWVHLISTFSNLIKQVNKTD
ncbi:MAG: PHP domain-containing protein [Anaerolineaceae bacterium]|nr:PHP domain-containing protein [Anaerolineaceae bacterium]